MLASLLQLILENSPGRSQWFTKLHIGKLALSTQTVMQRGPVPPGLPSQVEGPRTTRRCSGCSSRRGLGQEANTCNRPSASEGQGHIKSSKGREVYQKPRSRAKG